MSDARERPEAMSCSRLEGIFDAYVDGAMPADEAEMVARHLDRCATCDREIARWQQTRILLSTAVAEVAAAVDVSTLFDDVVSALEGAEERGGERRLVARERSGSARRSAAERRTLADRGRGARRSLAAAWRFGAAATASAAVAAAGVLLFSPVTQQASRIAAGPLGAPLARSLAELPRGGPVADVRPVSLDSARTPMSHIDGIEAAPGHTVTTWVQPRTSARVIWVQNRSFGAPVQTAGLSR